jgi:hypothetical protein
MAGIMNECNLSTQLQYQIPSGCAYESRDVDAIGKCVSAHAGYHNTGPRAYHSLPSLHITKHSPVKRQPSSSASRSYNNAAEN